MTDTRDQFDNSIAYILKTVLVACMNDFTEKHLFSCVRTVL